MKLHAREGGRAGAQGDFCLRGGWLSVGVGVGASGEAMVAMVKTHFHPRERLADALPVAAAEGDVGVFFARGFGFGGEAVGVEAGAGRGKYSGGAGEDVLAEERCARLWGCRTRRGRLL